MHESSPDSATMHQSSPDSAAAQHQARGFAPRFWSVVKANISAAGAHREEEFNEWYNREHVPEWTSKPGFRRAWRLRALEHPRQESVHRHAYYAIYELDSVKAFNDAIAASEGAPWGPWQQYVGDHLVDWERTYHRLLCAINPDETDARHWAIVKTDFHGSDAEEREFNEWYDEVHFPELISHEGFQGGWRLRLEPDEGDLGERGQRYWAVYRVSDAERFVAARVARARRGLPPWDGLWQENLRNTELNFYELLHHEPRHEPRHEAPHAVHTPDAPNAGGAGEQGRGRSR